MNWLVLGFTIGMAAYATWALRRGTRIAREAAEHYRESAELARATVQSECDARRAQKDIADKLDALRKMVE